MMYKKSLLCGTLLIMSVACSADNPVTAPSGTRPASPLAVDTDLKAMVSPASECALMRAGWLFCDDFEVDRLSKYFEHSNKTSFARTASVGFNGSTGMQARFAAGQTDAGSLKLAFGRTPDQYLRPVDGGTKIYREIYWRMYIRNDPTWTGGGGDKLSRVQSLANNKWAQAMVAPVWSGSGSSSRDYLLIDPQTGVSGNTLVTITYNDFARLKFLGARSGTVPVFSAANVGRWYCVEAHVKLNDAGKSNGVFEFWIDNLAQASRSDLNWVGGYTAYGLNTLFIENYWNNGSPKAQSRYIDNIVVSSRRIGCL